MCYPIQSSTQAGDVSLSDTYLASEQPFLQHHPLQSRGMPLWISLLLWQSEHPLCLPILCHLLLVWILREPHAKLTHRHFIPTPSSNFPTTTSQCQSGLLIVLRLKSNFFRDSSLSSHCSLYSHFTYSLVLIVLTITNEIILLIALLTFKNLGHCDFAHYLIFAV